MKKLLLLSAAVAVVAAAGTSGAADLKQYVSLKANYSLVRPTLKDVGVDEDGAFKDKDKLYDNAWGASLAYGVKMCAFRTELELNINDTAKKKLYDDEGVTKARTKTNSLFLNGYFDIPTKTAFTPYVGAGLGLARVKMVAKTVSEEGLDKFKMSRTKVAYQLGAGVGYELTKNWTLDAGYRYIDYGTVKKRYDDEDGIGKDKLGTKAHNFYLGGRYTF